MISMLVAINKLRVTTVILINSDMYENPDNRDDTGKSGKDENPVDCTAYANGHACEQYGT